VVDEANTHKAHLVDCPTHEVDTWAPWNAVVPFTRCGLQRRISTRPIVAAGRRCTTRAAMLPRRCPVVHARRADISFAWMFCIHLHKNIRVRMTLRRVHTHTQMTTQIQAYMQANTHTHTHTHTLGFSCCLDARSLLSSSRQS
jgi:hypothetical protein